MDPSSGGRNLKFYTDQSIVKLVVLNADVSLFVFPYVYLYLLFHRLSTSKAIVVVSHSEALRRVADLVYVVTTGGVVVAQQGEKK